MFMNKYCCAKSSNYMESKALPSDFTDTAYDTDLPFLILLITSMIERTVRDPLIPIDNLHLQRVNQVASILVIKPRRIEIDLLGVSSLLFAGNTDLLCLGDDLRSRASLISLIRLHKETRGRRPMKVVYSLEGDDLLCEERSV